jgi:hypothetical protein
MVLDPGVGASARPLRARRRRLVPALAIAALAILGAASASAELTQRGNLFVRFDGGISPRTLPRHDLAPISVRVEGTIRVPRGGYPRALRKIEVAVNRAGKLNAVGLPRCRRARLEGATPSEALAACGTALVGSGGVVGRASLADDQARTELRAEVLLFNSVDDGRPTVLAHAYQAQPVPISRVFAFRIRRPAKGTFGTVLTGDLPESLNRNGYLKSIFLNLERRYRFRGKERSYLSAACSAPAGFSVATFPFGRASMTFEDGRTLSSTLVRSCRVK